MEDGKRRCVISNANFNVFSLQEKLELIFAIAEFEIFFFLVFPASCSIISAVIFYDAD